LLDFATPKGFRLHSASFATGQFTAAATLSALPLLDGSIAYTYTSKPLGGIRGTASSALVELVQGFREIKLPRAPDDVRDWEIWQAGRRVDFRGRDPPVFMKPNCRHTLLWKNVSTDIQTGRNAYS
jgi:mitochondrial distribution and morphology protein 10